MSTRLQTTAVIRQRGQLTIPDKIRALLSWVAPHSVVTITTRSADELVVKPYTPTVEESIDWKKVWEGISLTRSFRGKRGNLSQFVVKDRSRH